MDKVTVAVRSGRENYRGFTGYIVEAGDEEALKRAKDWAREQVWDPVKREYVETLEPTIHTFDNEGFTARILESAGGSSQGGRLSFWAAEVEKDGVKFIIGVNDAVLADLIRSSEISNGLVKQKVMFARKAGQPGLIHEGMKSYEEATADMAHKEAMKKAKKTKKWEAGGVYQTITQTDVCICEAWDTMEEVEYEVDQGWYRPQVKTKLVKRDKPVKVYVWTYLSKYRHQDGIPETFNEFLKEELGDGQHIYFSAGTPPARAKTKQLEVTKADLKLIDKLLSLREDSLTSEYNSPKMKGRYKRVE